MVVKKPGFSGEAPRRGGRFWGLSWEGDKLEDGGVMVLHTQRIKKDLSKNGGLWGRAILLRLQSSAKGKNETLPHGKRNS